MAKANETSPAKTHIHTEAPWTARDDWPGRYSIVGPKQEILAVVNEFGIHEINEANARLIAQAPELLRVAGSAANAFKERISCLQDELQEDYCDEDDIKYQIGSYTYLLEEHRKVIARAEGKAT